MGYVLSSLTGLATMTKAIFHSVEQTLSPSVTEPRELKTLALPKTGMIGTRMDQTSYVVEA